jgi:hypothetical protein
VPLPSVLSLHDTLWRLCKFFHEIEMGFEIRTVVFMFIVLLTKNVKRDGVSHLEDKAGTF